MTHDRISDVDVEVGGLRAELAELRSALAEERVRAERFQRLLEGMPGIVYVDEPDATATNTFASSRMAELLGWLPGSEEASGWLDHVVHPADRAIVADAIERVNAGEPVAVEYRCVTGTGEIRWVYDDAAPQFDANGNVVAINGYITDISEHKQAEEERRLADERYRVLLEELPAAVYLAAADPVASTLFVSKRIEKILGYPAEAWTSDPDFFLDTALHPEDRDRLAEEVRRNNLGVPSISEYRCVHRDGHIVWLHDESTPQFDSEGNVVAVRGFVLDITDRKRTEDELKRSDERLRLAERMESIGRLAGGVAHDFNNLLTVIEGNVDLMLGAVPEDEPFREGLAEVAEAARRASTLTNQLLAYSRQQVLQPQVLDLNQIVERLGSMLQRLLGAKIMLELRVAPELWPVRVDRGQLEQVVVNLTVNARDAMPDGGVITIATGNLDVPYSDESAHPAGEYVTLAVTDTGVGFDEPVRAAMFEPFFTTKPVGKGTGLGLATVDGVVRQSGGWVDVVSSPGKGATFTVVLPRSHDNVEDPEPGVVRSSPSATQDDATILVVEDTGAVRDLVARTLEGNGYTVLAAATGEAALQLLSSTSVHVDLLLTDLVMPGLDGHSLAKRLEASRPGLRVVYMSGYTYDEIVRHGIEAAELAFLPKPFLPATLIDRVHTALEGPG